VRARGLPSLADAIWEKPEPRGGRYPLKPRSAAEREWDPTRHPSGRDRSQKAHSTTHFCPRKRSWEGGRHVTEGTPIRPEVDSLPGREGVQRLPRVRGDSLTSQGPTVMRKWAAQTNLKGSTSNYGNQPRIKSALERIGFTFNASWSGGPDVLPCGGGVGS
jgi:hypothetical protein